MIAAVKGWPAALSALLFFLPPVAIAAEDSTGAARELARKTAAFAGRGEPVAVAWRNVSSLGSSELTQARSAFEGALREAGIRVTDIAPIAEARLTLSENRLQYLLVEDIRKGEERQVWIASWKRTGTTSLTAPGIAIDKKLVWEQDEPILDVAFPAGVLLLLSPSRLALYARQGAQWTMKETMAITPVKPWPRDLRGHLRVTGGTFQALLPGMACNGTIDPALATSFSAECHTSEEPWVLESGSRLLLLGTFAASRNYFDGRVTSQSGQRKNVAPFYSAAAVEEQGRALWLLAMVDGRTQVLDAALDPVGTLNAAWGSDLAGTEAHCGSGWQVLATRAGDGSPTDAVQGFSIVDRAAVPVTAPIEFAGPVMALWTSGGTGATVVVHNLATGKYEAYALSVVCP